VISGDLANRRLQLSATSPAEKLPHPTDDRTVGALSEVLDHHQILAPTHDFCVHDRPAIGRESRTPEHIAVMQVAYREDVPVGASLQIDQSNVGPS
jgi:hypothetical protein